MNVGEYILQVGFAEGTEELIDDRMILLAKKGRALRYKCNAKCGEKALYKRVLLILVNQEAIDESEGFL